MFSALALALATVIVHTPNADLHLEVAQTQAQRERGLMNRNALAPRTGMIFVFDQDAPVEFWMKDTLVPLDMIFLSADGTVRRIYSNVAVVDPKLPDERIPHEAGSAKYVIELAAGEAVEDGIVAGIRLGVRDVPPPLPN